MTMELADRVALVTGAAGGLGGGIARKLAAEGARVALCDVRADAGAEVARSIPGSRFFPLDVREEKEWRRAVEAIVGHFGRIDILVNNAGINDRKPIMETTAADWERTLGINLTGAFHGIKAVAPHMRGRGGVIVNVSSTAGLVGHPDAPYSATKWALRGLTKTAALEFADWGIRVNSVHPGSVPTALHNNAPPGHAEVWRKLIPMQRAGRAEEIGDAVLFLASDRSTYITGTELAVDGGLSNCGLLAARARLLAEVGTGHTEDE